MNIEIRNIGKKDYKKAIQYAIKGMNFNRYLDSTFLLNLYGRYFWYLELCNATQIISAYLDGELVGVLLAEIKGEEKRYQSFWKELYVRVFDFLQHLFYKDGVNAYDEANKQMLKRYKREYNPDGEIRFLAVNPNIKGKGIGTVLLRELEKREQGKVIYLFTDTGCNYQFYEHRGFEKVGEKEILLNFKTNQVELKCLLYSKKLLSNQCIASIENTR